MRPIVQRFDAPQFQRVSRKAGRVRRHRFRVVWQVFGLVSYLRMAVKFAPYKYFVRVTRAREGGGLGGLQAAAETHFE